MVARFAQATGLGRVVGASDRDSDRVCGGRDSPASVKTSRDVP